MQTSVSTNTVQTQTGQTIGPSGYSTGTYIDVSGFKQLSVTMINDAATSCSVGVNWSNDGVTTHGDENLLPAAARNRGQATTIIKARYAKVYLQNNDAASHVMSAWAYLMS